MQPMSTSYLSLGRICSAERFFQDTTFSAFMESFNAAVGVPPERAAESVFKFDGDNLEPSGTPEVRWPNRLSNSFFLLYFSPPGDE